MRVGIAFEAWLLIPFLPGLVNAIPVLLATLHHPASLSFDSPRRMIARRCVAGGARSVASKLEHDSQ